MVVLAFGVALLVAFAQETVGARIAAGAPTVKRWGGIVLVIVGAWFVALGIFAETFVRVFPV